MKVQVVQMLRERLAPPESVLVIMRISDRSVTDIRR